MISDARYESSFEFLGGADGIATGPSNIASEATLANVRPIFKDFGELNSEHCGFLASGLCQHVETARGALQLFDPQLNELSTATALQQYCATVGTSQDGRSAELVQELIREELGGIQSEQWHLRDDFKHITVYDLKPAASPS